MLTKKGIEHGTVVRVRYKESNAVVGQSLAVAAAAIADGRADVLDAEGNAIPPKLMGIQRRRRVVEMPAIDPGPQCPFLFLPQAPRDNALAAKIS